MDSIRDFEDLLMLLEQEQAEYLIIGGLAFIYHAKPRYTKDMDLWVAADPGNIDRVNRALAAFGSPSLIEAGAPGQILQIGVEPNRIDVLQRVPGVRFDTAWRRRVRDRYGDVTANWIDLDTLLRAKARIDHPRHQDDARVLRDVKALRRKHRARRKSPT